ncbi:hypothetical protein TRFO_07905 [Tritrichomonas foetus]|uniref:Viral A-type inclusion protein n=1 Tax=Tritrichomonas foetus TaxID=1144522 RepID=A0A1J4JP99_9EUKA|nr:hypothetical protein TRFO_07905 [Tritrichomonas foetus]|eukprot:OHT00570.1 hypothetical protein TRFO_07905 [Tritrichomonas foetus]
MDETEPNDPLSSLLSVLETKIDLGDPDQVNLYTEILAERNLNRQFPKLCQLLEILLKNFSPNKQKNSTNDQNRRLVSYLQQCVSIFEAFSSNDEEIIQKVCSNSYLAEKFIHRDFFVKEADRLKSVLPHIQLTSPLSTQIPFKLENIKKIRQEVELSSNPDELRNSFGEICALFEFSSFVNDILIIKNNEFEKKLKNTALKINSLETENITLKQKIKDFQNDLKIIRNKGKISQEKSKIENYSENSSEITSELFSDENNNNNFSKHIPINFKVQIENLKEENSNLLKIVEQMKNKLEKFENNNNCSKSFSLSKDTNDDNEKNSKLNMQIDLTSAKKKIVELSRQISQLKNENLELHHSLSDANEANKGFNDSLQKLTDQIHKLKSQMENQNDDKTQTYSGISKISGNSSILSNSSFDGSNVESMNDVMKLKNILSSYRKQNTNYKAMNQSLQNKIIELKRNVALLDDEKEDLLNQLKALKNETYLKENSIVSLENEKSEISNSLSNMNDRIDAIKNKNKTLKNSLFKMNSIIDNLKNEKQKYEAVIHQKDIEISSLNQHVQQLNTDSKELNKKLLLTENNMLNFQKEYEQLTNSIHEKQLKLQKVKNQRDDARKSLEFVQNELLSTKIELTELKSSKIMNETAKSSIEMNYNSLKIENNTMKLSYESLKKENIELSKALEKIKAESSIIHSNLMQANERIYFLSLSESSVQSSFQMQKNELEETQKNLKLTSKNLKSIQSELEKIEREKIALNDKLLNLQKEIQKKLMETVANSDIIQSLKDSNKSLKERINELLLEKENSFNENTHLSIQFQNLSTKVTKMKTKIQSLKKSQEMKENTENKIVSEMKETMAGVFEENEILRHKIDQQNLNFNLLKKENDDLLKKLAANLNKVEDISKIHINTIHNKEELEKDNSYLQSRLNESLQINQNLQKKLDQSIQKVKELSITNDDLNDQIKEFTNSISQNSQNMKLNETEDLRIICELKSKECKKLKKKNEVLQNKLSTQLDYQKQRINNDLFKVVAALAEALNENIDSENLVNESMRMILLVKKYRARIRIIENNQKKFLDSPEPMIVLPIMSELDFEIQNLKKGFTSPK